jgi:hypothetical protein
MEVSGMSWFLKLFTLLVLFFNALFFSIHANAGYTEVIKEQIIYSIKCTTGQWTNISYRYNTGKYYYGQFSHSSLAVVGNYACER